MATGEEAYRWGKREPISAEGLTRRFLALHLRAAAMEELKVSYEEVLRTVSDRVLQRSEDVLAGLRGQLAQITQLEWLTALSTTSLTLVEGTVRSLVVLADQRALFAPGPYAILTRTTTPDDYAIIRPIAYDRTLGQLDFEVVTAVGRPGPFADWQVAALAGSTLAQMSLLAVGKAARDVTIAARDRAETAAGAADTDAAAAALDRIQTGLDRIATGNDRAATLILRNQTVEAAGTVDTSKFLQLDGLRPLTGRLQLAASASGRAAFNVPAGTDPGAPAEGDGWNVGGTLRAFLGGVVRVFAFLGIAQTWTARQTFAVPLNLAPGGTSAAPADGDLRITGSGVFARYGGVEAQLADANVVAAAIGGKADKASTPTLNDVRTLAIQLAKLKGSTVGMAAGVADDFKDQSGIDAPASVNLGYDASNNTITNFGSAASEELAPMTSDTTPAGQTASATAFGSDGGGSYNPFKAYDGSVSTFWASDANSSKAPRTIQRTTATARREASYAISARNDDVGSQAPTSFTRWGSNDGGQTKVTLDTRAGLRAFAQGERRVFTIPTGSRGNYTTYGLTMTNNGGAFTNFIIAAIESFVETSDALDLRSTAFTAAAVPAKGSLFVLAKAVQGAITPNTNLLADMSRDNGVNWTTGTLVAAGSYGGFTMYEANGFDISGQPSGTSMKWRLRTVGTALGVAVDAVVAQWG